MVFQNKKFYLIGAVIVLSGLFFLSGASQTYAGTLTVAVQFAGGGTGWVSSSPAGINCSPTCSAVYPIGTTLTLYANPATGSVFNQWGGDCSGFSSVCTVTMTALNPNLSVSASFSVVSYRLSMATAGTGVGATFASPFSSDGYYLRGTSVTLTPSPFSGSVFAGWSGDCSGTGSCIVSMTMNRYVTATFNLPISSLTVSKLGTGSGTVTSSPAGISCGTDCAENYSSGTSVTLSASPASGSTFAGWSGACSGTGSCTVSMTTARSVTATFNSSAPSGYSLSISKTGSGTVTSSPSGISCGSACSASYAYNTSVNLYATPGSGSAFTGWSGNADCSDGNVIMNASKTCTASFSGTNPSYVLITVVKRGTGSGTVTSSPSGLNCGYTCAAYFGYGVAVSVYAYPSSGSVFAGWSYDVSNPYSKIVYATFNLSAPASYSISITRSGTGTGTVTSSPAAINCGTICVAYGGYGTVVYLPTIPAAGSVFAGWSGSADCSDSTITLYSNVACNAIFNLATYPLTVSKAGTGSGTVVSSPVGINCGSDCAENYAYNTPVILTATPASGSVFAGWSGDVDCLDGTVTINAARACMATFDLMTQAVALTASPSSGNSPLSTLLTATVTGNIPGAINYSFWWNCNNSTTDVATAESACGVLSNPSAGTCGSNSVGYKCNAVANISQQVAHVYSPAGSYMAKVIIERGSASMSREARQNITVLNSAPSATNLNVIYPSSYCGVSPEFIILDWNFSDSDLGDSQSAYQVRVSKGAKVCDTGKITDSITSLLTSSINNLSGCSNFITYDPTATPYNWQVMVWDQTNTPSVWASGTFQTPAYEYPTNLNFTWSPNKPDTYEDTEFTASANCHDADNTCNNWTWDFNNDGTADATGQTIVHAFPVLDDYAVTLSVFDSVNSCDITKTITVDKTWEWPSWREILPF